MRKEKADAQKAATEAELEAARLEALRKQMENASEEERKQLRLIQQAAARWKKRHVAAAWNTWCEKYEQVLEYLQMLKKSYLRWTKRALSAAFQKWLSVTNFDQGPRPTKVKLVVQELVRPKGQYLSKGNRYGIAVAEAEHETEYEYASKAAMEREDPLEDDLSPPRQTHHGASSGSRKFNLNPNTPRGEGSPMRSPSLTPRIAALAKNREILLIKSSDTTLCISWMAIGNAPHTLNLGGKDGKMAPIAVLDPVKDKRNGQLCFTITHLKPHQSYGVRVDVGAEMGTFEGSFFTTPATGLKQGGTRTPRYQAGAQPTRGSSAAKGQGSTSPFGSSPGSSVPKVPVSSTPPSVGSGPRRMSQRGGTPTGMSPRGTPARTTPRGTPTGITPRGTPTGSPGSGSGSRGVSTGPNRRLF